MLAEFQRAGWNAVGVERASDVSERASSVVIVDSLEALPDDLRFDLVLMFQSFEHLADPVSVLRDCHRRMKRGARLVLSLPNASSWQARLFQADWFHLDVPRHLYHFNPASLRRCLGVCGFRMTSTRNAALAHDIYGWVQSVLNWVGLRQNALTRALMGLSTRRDRAAEALSVLFLMILLPPAVVLTLISCVVGRGAIMEIDSAAE